MWFGGWPLQKTPNSNQANFGRLSYLPYLKPPKVPDRLPRLRLWFLRLAARVKLNDHKVTYHLKHE